MSVMHLAKFLRSKMDIPNNYRVRTRPCCSGSNDGLVCFEHIRASRSRLELCKTMRFFPKSPSFIRKSPWRINYSCCECVKVRRRCDWWMGERTGVANPLKYAQIPFSVGDPAFTTVRGARVPFKGFSVIQNCVIYPRMQTGSASFRNDWCRPGWTILPGFPQP